MVHRLSSLNSQHGSRIAEATHPSYQHMSRTHSQVGSQPEGVLSSTTDVTKFLSSFRPSQLVIDRRVFLTQFVKPEAETMMFEHSVQHWSQIINMVMRWEGNI